MFFQRVVHVLVRNSIMSYAYDFIKYNLIKYVLINHSHELKICDIFFLEFGHVYLTYISVFPVNQSIRRI